MITGKKVKSLSNIRITHPGIRLESRGHVAAEYLSIPRGSNGDVVETNAAEAKIHFVWSATGLKGLYDFNDIYIWVKREWFGSLMEYVL